MHFPQEVYAKKSADRFQIFVYIYMYSVYARLGTQLLNVIYKIVDM